MMTITWTEASTQENVVSICGTKGVSTDNSTGLVRNRNFGIKLLLDITFHKTIVKSYL